MTRLVNTTRTIVLMVLLLLSSIVSMATRALKRRTTLVVRAWELDRGPTACIGSPRSMDRVTCAPWKCILHLARWKFRLKLPPQGWLRSSLPRCLSWRLVTTAPSFSSLAPVNRYGEGWRGRLLVSPPDSWRGAVCEGPHRYQVADTILEAVLWHCV